MLRGESRCEMGLPFLSPYSSFTNLAPSRLLSLFPPPYSPSISQMLPRCQRFNLVVYGRYKDGAAVFGVSCAPYIALL